MRIWCAASDEEPLSDMDSHFAAKNVTADRMGAKDSNLDSLAKEANAVPV
jgi:hypothetical protein